MEKVIDAIEFALIIFGVFFFGALITTVMIAANS